MRLGAAPNVYGGAQYTVGRQDSLGPPATSASREEPHQKAWLLISSGSLKGWVTPSSSARDLPSHGVISEVGGSPRSSLSQLCHERSIWRACVQSCTHRGDLATKVCRARSCTSLCRSASLPALPSPSFTLATLGLHLPLVRSEKLSSWALFPGPQSSGSWYQVWS